MNTYLKHYIDGAWVESTGSETRTVLNPATEEPVSEVIMGTEADVDKAVAAAKAAFPAFSQTTSEERVALLGRVQQEYAKRIPDIAQAISEEMGCPISIAGTAQSGSGMGHLASTIKALEGFAFSESTGDNKVLYEPVGVVALITPWNWPMNQIVAKSRPRARGRQLRDPQALRADPGKRAYLCRDPRRGGRSRGRVQAWCRAMGRGWVPRSPSTRTST